MNFLMKDSKIEARLVLSLEKALTRPEILDYMKENIIRDFKNNIDKITEEEISEFLLKQG